MQSIVRMDPFCFSAARKLQATVVPAGHERDNFTIAFPLRAFENRALADGRSALAEWTKAPANRGVRHICESG
jgi:hypothetical protein